MQTKNNSILETIVLTGGHAGATAISVIEELHNRYKNLEIYWIGSKYALEGKKIPTLEYQTFPKIEVKFISLFSGRLQRKFTRHTLPSILKIPFGFIHALIVLKKIKPKLIVSFGGYSSFPVIVIGKLLGIKIVIHEQTAVAGRANKYASFVADKIALAREESKRYFPVNKSVVTGNPISKEILRLKNVPVNNKIPIIFISGGSRGSEILNKEIELVLPQLISKYHVIHQTGINQEDYYLNLKNGLPEKLRTNYQIYGFIQTQNWPKLLSQADIVISRSGANIVSELIALKKPSILVPLRYAYLDEQTKNAELAQKFGIAWLIKQEDLNSELLLRTINEVFSKKEKIKDLKYISPDVEADKKFVDLLAEYL